MKIGLWLPLEILDAAKAAYNVNDDSSALKECIKNMRRYYNNPYDNTYHKDVGNELSVIYATANYWATPVFSEIETATQETTPEAKAKEEANFSIDVETLKADAIEWSQSSGANLTISEDDIIRMMLVIGIYYDTDVRFKANVKGLTPINAPNVGNFSKFNSNNQIITTLGNKWDRKMQNVLHHILTHNSVLNSDTKWDTIADICAGSLGVFNVIHDMATNVHINDLSGLSYNFYNTLQQQPAQLENAIKIAIDYPNFDKNIIKSNFEQLKNRNDSKWKNYSFSQNNPEIEAAVCAVILSQFSVYSKGESFNKPSDSKLQRLYPPIQNVSSMLQGKTITNEDLFDVLKDYQNGHRNTLVICDPPYIASQQYDTGTFTLDDHKKLADELIKVRCNYINRHFITYCRINSRLDSKAKLPSLPYLATMDYLYANRGLYYIDVINGSTAIERIITSFEFDGANEYKA